MWKDTLCCICIHMLCFPADTTAQQPHPPQQPPPEHVPLAAPQPLPSIDHHYKLLWMVAGSDDVAAVRRVIGDLAHSKLSEAHSTDMVTYWVSCLRGVLSHVLSITVLFVRRRRYLEMFTYYCHFPTKMR